MKSFTTSKTTTESLAFYYLAFLLQLELRQPETISYDSLNVEKYRVDGIRLSLKYVRIISFDSCWILG